jgi:hypothetical protein
MNKSFLEREVDRIDAGAARLRTLLTRQRAVVTRLGKLDESFALEARRLLKISEDLQALQEARRKWLVDQLFALTLTLLRAH